MPANKSAIDARMANRYRWVKVWLFLGCGIALLLIANAVRDYRFVARLLAIQQTRHQMTQISAQVEQQFRRSATGWESLETALGTSVRENASLTLRDGDGSIVDHVGPEVPGPIFTREQEHHAFANREPLFSTITTPEGDLVVEAFAVHPPRTQPPQPMPVATGREPSFPTLEIALPLRAADASVLEPIRRNVAINLTGAFTLLVTVVLAGTGLRSCVKGRRLEEQVEIASQVQSRLLPNTQLQLSGLQIATAYQPADQVGGDFYDIYASQPDEVAAVIGDVSGKGLPAALLMGVIRGAVRTATWQRSQADHEAESARLNQLLCERASENRFASLFWCSYQRRLGTMRYVNAGHCPPLLVRRQNGNLQLTRLGEGGPVLGLLQAAYKSSLVEVAPGDLLVMYSDGLIEAKGTEGEEFGEDRVEEILRCYCEESPEEIRDRIAGSWSSFASLEEVQDDLTMVIIRF
jgi:hypothetical protein